MEGQSEKIIFYKSSLSNEQNKNIELEKKIQELNKKIEDFQKNKNENKIKFDFRTKSDLSISNTNNNYNNIENDMKDISPTKFIIVKCVQIEDLKWYLFKKKNIYFDYKNYSKRYSQRNTSYSNNSIYIYIYISRHEKYKNNEINRKDNFDKYICKPMKNQKEYKDFGTLPEAESSEDKNKIIEMQKELKKLKDKYTKKEEDYNRMNINYAKLLKKTKNPENNQEKLLETINKLKIENKKLNNSLIKCISEKNIIGISFIEDDLESSFFIDNFCFDSVLDEINKSNNKFMTLNNNLQRNAKQYHEKKNGDIKLENNNIEQKDDSDK